MSNHAHIVTPTGLIVLTNGKQYVVGDDHPNFTKIKDALLAGAWDTIAGLADIRASVQRWLTSDKSFELKNDLVHFAGVPFSQAVTDKVLAMIDAGSRPDPLYNFLRKVRANPLQSAQDELLLFCAANGFMIHEDGDIIAYKSVRGNYTDIHSGKFSNKVGEIVTMAREDVDADRARTCSVGLHFAAHEYASTWAGSIDGVNRRLMVMKINPADVVSIPNDYNNQKGRTWRYEVVAELTANASTLPPKAVYTTADIKAAAKPVDNTARIAKLKAEKARKENVLKEKTRELEKVTAALDALEALGLTPSEDAEARELRLEKLVVQLKNEIRDLDLDLASLV